MPLSYGMREKLQQVRVVQYTRTVTDRETMVSVRRVRTDRETHIRIVEKG